MGVIPINRNTKNDKILLLSPAVNRNFLPLYHRAIIFKNYGWQFENQREPPHITMDRIGSHASSPKGDFREPTHEVEPLTFSTPGPTPLRTHLTSTFSTAHTSDSAPTTFPSLLPATGTTLIIPPPYLGSTILATGTTSMVSNVMTEIPTLYGPPPSSAPSIMTTTSTKMQFRLPIPAIAAITAGGLFALVGSIVLFFWLRTPRRRRLPIPSLPKLENGDIDEKDSTPQESPLFGPRERLSESQQHPGLNPQWSWVTYPQDKQAAGEGTKLSGDNDAALNSGRSTTGLRPPEPALSSRRRSSSIYPASGYFQSLSAPVGSPPLNVGHPSLQQVQAAITRATSRMSAMSLTCTSNFPIGKEDSGTSYTADGHDVMKRRSRTLRKSRSNSIYEDRRRSSRLPAGLAYDGADVTSPIPAMEFMPLESPGLEDGYDLTKARRTRIQTPYYTPGSYPRISSAIPTTYGVATRVKLGDGTSIRGLVSPKLKSESLRAKETQALTRALGLASPAAGDYIPSPQPTLCPDDSLSVVESRRLLKQRNKRASTYLGDDKQFNQVSDGRRQPVATPTRSVVAVASGSLISAEDIKALGSGNSNPGAGLAVSLTGPTLVNSKSMGTKSTLASSRIGRADDRPPRVPSPPPLPSLAQMALEQHNPDAYGNYRSPTYSIYNLYDDKRRSTIYGGKR